MFRKISDQLLAWKSSAFRKPLILQGARQVGKTFSVLEFGKSQYENFVYFNFETDPNLAETFAGNIQPAYLVPLLSAVSGISIVTEKTLIIFDEVQLCERALTALKYFCEEAPGYHIIACGSLLGVAVNRKQFSFPVGKVDIFVMYPMDFEEFLLALGKDDLSARIRECFSKNSEMPAVLHEALLRLYREYLVVGGLPECVLQYVLTQNFTLIRNTQNNILISYVSDMSKYNKAAEIQKTSLTYNSITAQLSKRNTRFQYKLIKPGARASEFENAIEWLNLSGITSRVFRVEHAKKPLEDNRDIDAFKIYIADVGLLCAKKEISDSDILYLSDELNDFKGGLAENYVNSQLVANGYKTYYWESDRGAEVDFVIHRNGDIIPIEVKSADNTKAKSLGVYIASFKPKYAIKASTRNFGFENGIKSIPLYAVFCI